MGNCRQVLPQLCALKGRGIESMAKFKYLKPSTLQEALCFLNGNESDKKVISGGTDIMVQLRNNKIDPEIIIDISEIENLKGIHSRDGFITIGAATTLTEIAESDIVKRYCPILAQAAASVGATQIRNRGTIGGNVCNASPAADTIPALVALGAVATVVSVEQEREVLLEELFVGVGKTAINSNELLTFISIPQPTENSAGSFFKLGKRKAQAISIVNGAVQIGVNAAEGKFTDVHVVMGSVAPTVLRIREAEESLIGRSINRQNIENAAEIVKNKISPISDVRATADYRKDVSGNLFIEAMSDSLEQLGVDVSYPGC
jgi:carbon-monoxide dehydrogenase medium subunit